MPVSTLACVYYSIVSGNPQAEIQGNREIIAKARVFCRKLRESLCFDQIKQDKIIFFHFCFVEFYRINFCEMSNLSFLMSNYFLEILQDISNFIFP